MRRVLTPTSSPLPPSSRAIAWQVTPLQKDFGRFHHLAVMGLTSRDDKLALPVQQPSLDGSDMYVHFACFFGAVSLAFVVKQC